MSKQRTARAWIVHADYPFVTMDPAPEGGLPRTELFDGATIDAELADAREKHAKLVESLLEEAERECGPQAAGMLERAAAWIRTGQDPWKS